MDWITVAGFVLGTIAIIAWCVVYAYVCFKRGVKWEQMRQENNAKDNVVGTLIVENDPDDGIYFFLQIDRDPSRIISKKRVTFDVDINGIENRTLR